MSKLKATPGPWYAEENNMHTGCVATCDWYDDQWWEVWTPMWMDGGSAKANAHLIAAAPDLYAALQEAIDCGMVPKSTVNGVGANRHSRQVKAADAIRAALDKARGET